MKFHKETEFQETEIGEIPRDWKVVRLKDVAEIRGSRKVTQGSDTLIFIPMEAIPDDGVYAGFELRDANEVKSYVYCEPGDILLAKITPSFENGKQGIVPEEIPGKFALATTEVYPIKCKDVNKFFLFYLLKYPPLRNKLVSLTRGTTGRRRVPREALENQLIPYPPLKEQENIGKVLLTIQNLKESMRDAIDRLERLKRGLMSELLTGRIRVREENGRLSFYRETELQETEIGEIPRGWHVAKLGELIEMNHGERPEVILQEGDVPIYGGGGLYGFTNTYLVDKPYVLILARVGKGSVGKVYLARGRVWVTDNAIYGYSKDPNGITTVYAYYWLLFDKTWIEKYVRRSAGGYAIITLNSLNNLKLPLPPLNEQKGITKILSTIDKAVDLHYKGKERLERLKRSLMDLLLTGKVRVVDGDVGS
jgi:type I restriction enzyme S subunit